MYLRPALKPVLRKGMCSEQLFELAQRLAEKEYEEYLESLASDAPQPRIVNHAGDDRAGSSLS